MNSREFLAIAASVLFLRIVSDQPLLPDVFSREAVVMMRAHDTGNCAWMSREGSRIKISSCDGGLVDWAVFENGEPQGFGTVMT